MTELVQPATCLIQIHNAAIHMDFKPENLVFDSKNNLKAIDFGGSILLPKGKSRSNGIRVERKTTSFYLMPPEINTVLKSELNTHFKSKDFATYNEEYATTKTDIWEFGIFIFQIILLNDNQLSVSALAKINNFFNYLFLAQHKIMDNLDNFDKTITLLLRIMINYPSLFLLATNLLDGDERKRLSDRGNNDFLTSICRIGNKSETFELFFKTKDFGIFNKKYRDLLKSGQKELLYLENHEKRDLEECDRTL
uniref:Protein kinase domain-containing protein n=1 Tax=Meloidogyne incognita TaxID=6306 RepID=A0A914NJS7_MELIC